MPLAESAEFQGPLTRVLLDTAGAFESHKVRYALIGAVAAGYRSRPRSTQDLDFLVDIPQVVLPRLLDNLQERGFEFDQIEVIRRWIQEHMVVLSCQGIRIDWLKPVIPLYQHVIDSASSEPVPGGVIRIASTEGLILTKLLASRTLDQADIENLLAANRGELDLDLIRREWDTVGDADDPRMKRFDEMVHRFYLPPPSPH